MKRLVTFIFSLVIVWTLIGCDKKSVGDVSSVTFEAEILEISDSYYLVCPVEGSQELKSADQITIPIGNLESSLKLTVGDIIKIKYDGEIAESDPAQISEVYDIKIVKKAERTDEMVTYNGITRKKSELCNQTLRYLELTEEEKSLSSYFPPEFVLFEENWGITLTAENITSTTLTLVCTQSGGEATGELQTGSWYILEKWTQEAGWKEVQHIKEDNDLQWTMEAYSIPMEDTVKWEMNWAYIYEKLSAGKYRVGKEIMDFRKTGDYDTAIYYAEFEITQ